MLGKRPAVGQQPDGGLDSRTVVIVGELWTASELRIGSAWSLLQMAIIPLRYVGREQCAA